VQHFTGALWNIMGLDGIKWNFPKKERIFEIIEGWRTWWNILEGHGTGWNILEGAEYSGTFHDVL
jgi:hypothetical protein